MKTEALFIVVLLLIAPLLFSQENLEETLRWLPGEDYSFIAHYDLEKTRTKSFDSLLKKERDPVFLIIETSFFYRTSFLTRQPALLVGNMQK